MSNFEKKKLENDFRKFVNRHFEKPSKCKNLGQIQYYVKELSQKIDELKAHFNYVPKSAYVLLSQYNATQNRLIFSNFQKTYAW